MLLNCGVGEDSWESLRLKEIQLVHPKGNQFWIFIGKPDAEAKAIILWPPVVKNWLIGKDSDAGKDWRREEKGMTEDEMVGWHHRLDGHEQAPGVGDGQRSLACCSPRGHKELDTTEWLNWAELNNEEQVNTRVKYIFSKNFTKGCFFGLPFCIESSMFTHFLRPWKEAFNFKTICSLFFVLS